MEEAETVSESVEVGGALQDPAAAGGFDATLFGLLLAILAFVMVTNLWLRWRAEGLSFGEGIRRSVAALSGDRSRDDS